MLICILLLQIICLLSSSSICSADKQNKLKADLHMKEIILRIHKIEQNLLELEREIADFLTSQEQIVLYTENPESPSDESQPCSSTDYSSQPPKTLPRPRKRSLSLIENNNLIKCDLRDTPSSPPADEDARPHRLFTPKEMYKKTRRQ